VLRNIIFAAGFMLASVANAFNVTVDSAYREIGWNGIASTSTTNTGLFDEIDYVENSSFNGEGHAEQVSIIAASGAYTDYLLSFNGSAVMTSVEQQGGDHAVSLMNVTLTFDEAVNWATSGNCIGETTCGIAVAGINDYHAFAYDSFDGSGTLAAGTYDFSFLVDTPDYGGGFLEDGQIAFSAAVPVPAAVWLFGSALAGLGWLRRKQTG
jgi:hypothetical protein